MLKTISKAALLWVLMMPAFAGQSGAQATGGPQTAPVQEKSPEPWRKEFDDVCSKTQDAMTFSVDELTVLLRRCEDLQPQIEKLDESRRKVYSGRLRMCRGLYAYVLDAKKPNSQKDEKK